MPQPPRRPARSLPDEPTPAADSGPAITPEELAERVREFHGVDAAELTRWLVDAQLATLQGGLLRPTATAVRLGASIG